MTAQSNDQGSYLDADDISQDDRAHDQLKARGVRKPARYTKTKNLSGEALIILKPQELFSIFCPLPGSLSPQPKHPMSI